MPNSPGDTIKKHPAWSYKYQVLILITVIGILRLTLAFIVELGNDEAYYWLYSQHLKSNYFDHPPMIALWIRTTTLNLSLQDYPGFIRLGSVISCCIASWFMFKCVSALSNQRAGWFAACLYNAFFYTGVTAGIFVWPDAPQMLFWTWSLYLVVLITLHEHTWKYWILFGVISGLCIMSKIHGLFIWIGFGCYTLFYKRNWLTNIRLYAAVLISISICLPILFWNIHYNFLTYRFNGPRIDIENSSLNWLYFLNEIYGQVFKNNPLNFVFIISGLLAFYRLHIERLPALIIFNFTGILLASVLLIISLFKPTLPHWSGPVYVTLLPLAAIWLDRRKKNNTDLFVRISVAMHIFVLIYCVCFINFYPGSYGVSSGRSIGSNDKSLDLYGWKQAGEKFDSIYKTCQQKKLIPPNTPVVCYGWWGAHVEYYFCRPLQIPMIGLGDVMKLHEYAWMNELRTHSANMQEAFCIVPSDAFYNAKRAYSNYYNQVDSFTNIQIFRNGEPAHNFYIYHLSGWKGNLPLTLGFE